MSAPTPPADAQGAAPEEWALRELVQRDVARMVFDRSRTSNLLTIPGSLLIAWVVWPYNAGPVVLCWLLAKQAVCAWRWWIIRSGSHGPAAELPEWGRHYTWALACDGALFGAIATVLVPWNDPVLNAAMAATLVGIAAIGLVVLSPSWVACIAFTMPLMLPGLALQFMHRGRVGLYLGCGMLLYTVLLAMESRRAAAHTLAMLTLRRQTDQLAREREAALEDAERSNAAKSQFLATISHEMRTPLHGILGLTRELQRDDAGPAGRQEQLRNLERTGDHLLGLINDVLDFSKVESGHLGLEPQDFELGALLQGVHALFTATAAEKRLGLRLQVDLPTPCWLHGDAVRLRQILLNLLGNAFKFTDAGEVCLRASARPQADEDDDDEDDAQEAGPAAARRWALRIEVCDTGPGVAPADRERIFDAFHQLDGSWSRPKGGTGLGLTISRELARAMDGELSCVDGLSGDAAQGACFRLDLLLPEARLTAAGVSSSAARAAPLASTPDQALPPVPVQRILGARVLLAEDNEVNALIAQAMLERCGASVTLAGDGAAAVAAAQDGGFDLILMDCQMPQLDGFEATARIRQHEREQGLSAVPIVALTANIFDGDREHCLAAGMNDHLGKPFREEQLWAVLQRHLRGAGAA